MLFIRVPPLPLRSAAAASAIAAALALVGVPRVNAVCTHLAGPPDLTEAPIVFVGTTTAVSDAGYSATLTVEEIWKGPNLPDHIVVHGGSSQDEDPRTWQADVRYLQFAYADKDGELLDNGCSWTSVYKAEFDALRPANAHPPQGPPTSGPPGATPIAAVFLAILVFGSIGVFFLYRRGGPTAGPR